MRELAVNSWNEFLKWISETETEFGYHQLQDKSRRNTILYRGQTDSTWRLTSTLERYSRSRWTVESYTKLLKRLVPHIESFTEERWAIPKSDVWVKGLGLPCHELWAYVRHCGFPSPLLDWTTSPYIAAFFACEENKGVERAAIFAYVERPTGTKVGEEESPQISIQNVSVRTHKRHFLQQSYYTICTKLENGSNRFACHEDVFADSPSNMKRQDVLLKITIPRSERLKAISELNKMNINHFSLFQSEESLMHTLAFREIDLAFREIDFPKVKPHSVRDHPASH